MSVADDVRHWLRERTVGVDIDRRWLVYGPPVLLITVFFIAPISLMIVVSFYPDFTGVAQTGVTLQFYQVATSRSIYLNALWRSVWYGFVTTVVCLLLGYPLVYAAVKVFREYEILILLLSVLPFWVMYLIRMFGWIAILKRGGVIDGLTELFNLGVSIDLLFTWQAVIIGLVFSWFPLMVLPLYASLKSLDDSLLEASKDLGANSFRTFRRVTIPETKSAILAGSILVFVPSFGSYVTPILLGGPNSSQMLANVIGRQFSEAFNWPLGAALGTLMIIVVLASIVIVQRYATVMEVSER